MSEDDLEKWAQSFEVLGNPVRLAVVIALYGSDRLFEGANSLTFGQIKEVVGMPTNQSMVYHLLKLLKIGMITKKAYKDEKGRVYPLYSLTAKGTQFLEDLGLRALIDDFIARKAVP